MGIEISSQWFETTTTTMAMLYASTWWQAYFLASKGAKAFSLAIANGIYREN